MCNIEQMTAVFDDCLSRVCHSFTASRAATPDPDSATYDENVGLDQELSASGTYTLTKVECTTLRSILSRLSRSADLPLEEDMSGMVRDSLLAKIDEGEEWSMLPQGGCSR